MADNNIITVDTDNVTVNVADGDHTITVGDNVTNFTVVGMSVGDEIQLNDIIDNIANIDDGVAVTTSTDRTVTIGGISSAYVEQWSLTDNTATFTGATVPGVYIDFDTLKFNTATTDAKTPAVIAGISNIAGMDYHHSFDKAVLSADNISADGATIVSGSASTAFVVDDSDGSGKIFHGSDEHDAIYNSAKNLSVKGGDGDDVLVNYGQGAYIDGQAGDDFISVEVNSTVNTGDGDDSIVNGIGTDFSVENFGAGDKIIFADTVAEVDTIDGGALITFGDGDTLTVGGLDVTLNEWQLNDNIATYSTTAELQATDNIISYDTVASEPLVELNGISSTDNLTPHYNTINISGDAVSGDVEVISNRGGYEFYLGGIFNDQTFTGTDDNDTVTFQGSNFIIDGSDGDDLLYNNGSDSVEVNGGDGDDTISGENGDGVTLSGGTGDDVIELQGGGAFINYASGDGNDSVNGFDDNSTLNVTGDNYSTVVSGNDVIVKVGDYNVTLLNAAGLSSLNINGNSIDSQANVIVDMLLRRTETGYPVMAGIAFSPDKYIGDEPTNYADKETWTIDSADGLELKAVHYTPQSSNDKWVIIVHGYGHNHKHMYRFTEAYLANNYNVLVVDERAAGDSEGTWLTMGAAESADIALWTHEIAKHNSNAKITLHGVSMGAATAMLTASRNDITNVTALVEDCGYSAVMEVLNNLNATYIGADQEVVDAMDPAAYRATGHYLHEAAPINSISAAKMPTLFITGTDDSVVPATMLTELYDASGAEVKEQFLVEGAPHALAGVYDVVGYANTVFRFNAEAAGEGWITNSSASSISLRGTIYDDTISTTGDDVTVSVGNGDDIIVNGGSSVYISGGTGNNFIELTGGENITVNVADGDDTITVGDDVNNIIIMDMGDGDEIHFNDAITTVGTVDGGVVVTTDSSTVTLGGVSSAHVEQWSVTDNIATFTRSTVAGVYGDGNVLKYNDTVAASETLVELRGISSTEDLTPKYNTINIFSDAVSGDVEVISNRGGYQFYFAGIFDDQTFTGTDDNDTVTFQGTNFIVEGGDGDDVLYNDGADSIMVSGGDGDDTITNENGGAVTIDGGAGDDVIELRGETFINYASGDGNDTINGFDDNSTLNITDGNYSTVVSGNDVIVKVGDYNVTLLNAAGLSSLDINGTNSVDEQADVIIDLLLRRTEAGYPVMAGIALNPEDYPVGEPTNYASKETWTIDSADGLELKAVHYTPDEPNDKWVLIIHGYGHNHKHMYAFALAYLANNYNVLMVDERAAGDSEGTWLTMGAAESADIALWTHEIARHNPNAKITLHGASMGAATAMLTAARDDITNVTALVEDCGYTAAMDVFNNLNATYVGASQEVLDALDPAAYRATDHYLHEAAPINSISAVKLPSLFINGTADSIVPVTMMSALYDASGAEVKEQFVVEGAPHGLAGLYDLVGYANTVLRFNAEAAGEGWITDSFASSISLRGTIYDDTITSIGDDVTVNTGTGDDIINNGGDSSIIYTEDGNDYIINSGDKVYINSGTGSDTIVNSGDKVTMTAGADNDNVENYGDNALIYGTGASDTVENYGDNSRILTGSGSDSIFNSGDNVYINGETGDDTIVSGGASATIDGGGGNNFIQLSSDGGNLIMLRGNTTVEGFNFGFDENSDTVYVAGSAPAVDFKADGLTLYYDGGGSLTFSDITSTAGMNIYYEESKETAKTVFIAEDEWYHVAEGAAQYYVGATASKNHGVDFSGVTSTVNVTLDTEYVAGPAEYLSNVYSIIGGDGDTTITGSAQSDTIMAGEGDTTIDGRAGDDVITVGDSNVLINYTAGEGNDIIIGFDDNSTLNITGDNYSTVVSGEDVIVTVGDNTLTLTDAATVDELNIVGDYDGAMTIDNTVDGAMIVGTRYNDKIVNYGTQVTIRTLGGDDYIANAVDSSVTTASLGNIIDAGDGNDFLYSYHSYNPTMLGGDGDDYITVTKGHLTYIDGGDGSDTIVGQDSEEENTWAMGGHATILGGDGDDYIEPYYSNDSSIDAGAGDDTIIINGTNTTVNGGSGNNFIRLTNDEEGETGQFIVMNGNNTVENFGLGFGENSDTIYSSIAPAVGYIDGTLTFYTSDASVTLSDVTTSAAVNLYIEAEEKFTHGVFLRDDDWHTATEDELTVKNLYYVGASENKNHGVDFGNIKSNLNITLDTDYFVEPAFWVDNVHSIIGGAGNTTITGSAKSDTITAGGGKTVFNAGDGGDVLTGNGTTTFNIDDGATTTVHGASGDVLNLGDDVISFVKAGTVYITDGELEKISNDAIIKLNDELIRGRAMRDVTIFDGESATLTAADEKIYVTGNGATLSGYDRDVNAFVIDADNSFGLAEKINTFDIPITDRSFGGNVLLEDLDISNGTFVNFITADGKKNLFGWDSLSRGGLLDGNDITGKQILFGGAPNVVTTVRGGNSNDTIFGGKDGIVSLSGGEDKITLRGGETKFELGDGSVKGRMEIVTGYDVAEGVIKVDSADGLSVKLIDDRLHVRKNSSVLIFDELNSYADADGLQVNSGGEIYTLRGNYDGGLKSADYFWQNGDDKYFLPGTTFMVHDDGDGREYYIEGGSGRQTITDFDTTTDRINLQTVDGLDYWNDDLFIRTGSDGWVKVLGAANKAVNFTVDGTKYVAALGKELTYSDDVQVYGDLKGDGGCAISVGSDYNGDEVAVYMNGMVETNGKAKTYLGVDKIDASAFSGKASLIGSEQSDVIIAAQGATSLWGGNGGNDTLIGNGGANNFFHFRHDGADVIENAADGDIVTLGDLTLDDIITADITTDAIELGFSDGGAVTVNGTADVTVKLGDGTSWKADHTSRTWRQA